MPIRPITAPRLYLHIAASLAAAIDAGEFTAGERLPGERELARRLHVSRASLREALSALELEGYVDIRVGSGAYVAVRRRRSPRDSVLMGRAEISPLDTLRARRLIEPETAALAARHATAHDIESIGEALARLGAPAASAKERTQGDRLFHVRIAEAAGNAALAEIVRSLWAGWHQPLTARMEALFVTPERRRDNVGEHRRILAAIRAGDAAAARAAMRLHLRNAERQRLTLLRGGR